MSHRILHNATTAARQWVVDGVRCIVPPGAALLVPDAVAVSFPKGHEMTERADLPTRAEIVDPWGVCEPGAGDAPPPAPPADARQTRARRERG